ncbi:MAG: hypothetical protein RIR18_1387 [Pseudomonadota bacterium]|jgi:type I restriction enzyme M protein
MLDADTKRRIDSCRDILVGKVPDPKSQVEQITIALIYKFMDDMDAEAEELGGERTFFAGEYAKYGWAKLMAPNMGGFDVLALYSEAIGKMNENPGIPALFRDIFKNAYLPYRDPETLRSFLKEIDVFTYDHSEKLGDAFEYLLSVLGSQGDAGQFRTPRHIIDFMVEVVDPKKHESILDPACGTAGFLISAWKHILARNTQERAGDQLSPDERANLAANIHGYDISPDMVRLSLVNLYLHGFTDPHIVEYDTLTSEDKWNETADVILANPPFMSPKGGIKPHKRFSVQATRSEVLFVDYIAEHLSPQGRAAIVVPEGIIFQSGTAYKQLREMLVKTSLVAVVSLPAGVFNPYSGVKTSILILDKRQAKTSDSVLFVKVENDGFNLGAQRRAVTGSDLPEAKRLLAEFLSNPAEFENGPMAHKVTRERIGENGEWGLSGERYQVVLDRQSVFELLPFAEVCTLEYGASLPKTSRVDGPYPVLGSNGITGYHNEYLIEGPAIVVGRKGSAGEVTFVSDNCYPIDTTYFVKPVNPEESDIRFLYHVLKTLDLPNLKGGAGIPGLNRSDVYNAHKIPLPPLAIQQEIVAEIEGYQKIIDGARQVVENYKPRIDVKLEWPLVALGEVSEVTSSKRILAEEYVPSGTPFYRTKEIVELNKGKEISLELFISEGRFESIRTRFGAPAKGDLLVSAVGTIGISWVVADDRQFYFKDGNLLWVRNLTNLDPYFLKYCLDFKFSGGIDHIVFGAAYKALTIEKLKEFKIPLPPLETQRAIVAEIETEQALVNANKQLIERFEAKIKATINRVWGEA